MDREQLIALCLDRPGAYLDAPWGDEDSVVKVGGKIFCFLGASDGPTAISVKNTREAVAEWRDRFPDHIGVPRYLKKDLWNSVDVTASAGPDADDVRELIDDSYRLVVESLPKSKRPA
jgi:predicted DNA-binding protein (MmcQ/YjbR family)